MTTLYTFQGTTDGAFPGSGVIRDGAGNLFGTTSQGGNLNCAAPSGCGTVFRLDGAGRETVLHAFAGSPDGQNSNSPLFLDARGNLFGTTVNGGLGSGIIYAIRKNGQEKIVYNFGANGVDGSGSFEGLVPDARGNLFSVTFFGGEFNQGTVFKLSAQGKESIVYTFAGGPSDGANPIGPPVLRGGAIFGSTQNGGSGPCNSTPFAQGCGTIFKLTAGGETVLHDFTGGADGAFPRKLILGRDGNLYGITGFGGTFGSVIRVDPGSGAVTILHSFAGGSDGNDPADLLQDSAGNFFGDTRTGGDATCNCGTIFRLSPDGQGGWTETVLFRFTGGEEGSFPQGGLNLDENNRTIYGTTFGGNAGAGTVFKFTY